MIRVLLAEDVGMMRGALATLLRLEPDIDIVAELKSGDEVLASARQTNPDVALLDIEMPGISGLAVARLMRDAFPRCKVVILTTFGRPGYLREAMDAGVSGYVVKDGPVTQLAGIIRRVLAGERVIDPTLAVAALTSGPNPLTDRERDVLVEALNGSPVGDIASRLHLSKSTVRNYLSSSIQKTGTRNRIEAAQRARDRGWL